MTSSGATSLTPTPTVSTSSSDESISHFNASSSGVLNFGKFNNADIPKLKAIFFAEFDNTIGSVIRYQIPEDVVTTERFKSFSAAIITKPELYNRLIKVNFHDYKVMGHPICLVHDSYDRDYLKFNMCFVVAKESTVDCMYEPLVQKCAEYLTELEQECRFIYDPEKNKRIPDIMRKIFNDLNANKECVLSVDNTMTTMYLKLCPSYRGIEPPKITPYMVPMFTRQIDFNSDPTLVDKMDVLSQKIIPKIDGVRCVKEIASEVDIDPDLVSRCIRNLYFYECVSMVPLFLYSNTYVATEKLHSFYQQRQDEGQRSKTETEEKTAAKTEIERCLEFVRLRKGGSGEMPKFCDVFRLYMSLRCGMSLRQWCEEMRPQRYNVDERRLVQFGMHQKFLRKLSIYPVSTVSLSGEHAGKIYTRCDGTKALEDLAVLYSMPPEQLQRVLESTGHFEMISK